MKLRICGNSIRLRISPSDLDRLEKEGRVECWTGFGPHRRFVYALELGDGSGDLAADFAQDALTLRMPSDWMSNWSSGGQVGFESMQAIDGDQQLHILVEMDADRLHEDAEGERRYQPEAA